MKGFKAFNANMMCLAYQFEIGKTYTHDGPVILCESGFHFCTDAQDILKYYCDTSMRICEIEASGEITSPEYDCSKRSCSTITIVREILFDKFIQYVTSSEYAYYWARDIGNHNVMMLRITESQWAYCWARDIGNHDVMMLRITESRDAYRWALNIGNRAEMMPKITDPYWLELFNRLN